MILEEITPDVIHSIYGNAVDIINDMGFDATFDPDYSGRGMMGKTTPAIIGACGTLVGAAVVLATKAKYGDDISLDDLIDIIPIRWDNMGTDKVFY